MWLFSDLRVPRRCRTPPILLCDETLAYVQGIYTHASATRQQFSANPLAFVGRPMLPTFCNPSDFGLPHIQDESVGC